MAVKIAMLIPDNRDEAKDWEAPAPRFGTAPTALLEGLAQIPGCEIHIVCCVHRPVESPKKLAANIWYHSLVVRKWGWLLAYIGCVWKLHTTLRRLRPDVVHAQGTERYCALGAVFSGFPNLITIHGNMRAVRKTLRANIASFHGLAALLETVSLHLTKGVICLTTYTKKQIGNIPGRTWIVPNAVDSTYFDLTPQKNGSSTIVCVGTVDVRKNQERLIRAVEGMRGLPSMRLIFAGAAAPSDPYAAAFLKMCSERNWCDYKGILNRADLQRLLTQSSLLVLPSLEDNCPMVILEAMAAGVPVAASRVGGIPDIVENEVDGLLFDPLDEEAIRSAIESLLHSPEKREALRETASERARVRFAPIVVARRHLRIYEELLSNA